MGRISTTMHRRPTAITSASRAVIAFTTIAFASFNATAAEPSEATSNPPTSSTTDVKAAETAAPSEPAADAANDTAADTAADGANDAASDASKTPAVETAATPVPPANFVDDDGNGAPTPIVHTFRQQNYVNGKVGAGLFLGHSWPFGARTGYVTTFTEGDASGLFDSGFGVHWDVEVRGAMSAFEARADPAYAVNKKNQLVPVGDLDAAQGETAFYRQPTTFATGRTTDYLRIDRLALSYDFSMVGADIGRTRVPEAALTVVDGLHLRFDFGSARFGLFGGLKPNPWHQQVVGAGSGGFIGEPVFGGLANEFVPVRWGTVNKDNTRGFAGETTGPYANDIGGTLVGQGYPWTQVGSYRFQTLGIWSALRFNPAFFDAALVVDTFIDPNSGVDPVTNELNTVSDGFQLDRVWLYTSGGVRVFDPLTVSWRGTLDVIGARPLFFRDLFLDVTWRNLGPVTLSASYFKINTYATAYSYARFFRPMENVNGLQLTDVLNRDERATYEQTGGLDADQLEAAQNRYNAYVSAGANINNTNLFVVDRDRISATASLLVGDSFQFYTDLLGERRNDSQFVLTDAGTAFGGYADGLANIGETLPQQFACSQPQALEDYDPNDPTKNTPPPGLLTGSNPTFPVWADRCKLGFSIGMRDPFLARVGSFDLRATQLFGYFSSTTRLSGRIGIAMSDRLFLDLAAGLERNDNHRVYQPGVRRCPGDGPPVCDPTVITAPQDAAEATNSDFRFLPWPTNVYDVSAAMMWRIAWGWFFEVSYFGALEEIPYMGDYFQQGAGDPQRRDTVQYTQVLTMRSLYRF